MARFIDNYNKKRPSFTQIFLKRKFSRTKTIFNRKSRHRGISEIIVTAMLLTITVIGAVMVSSFFQSSKITDVGSQFNIRLSQSSVTSLKITGYDTRDGSDLSGVGVLDNKFDSLLCTKNCNTASVNALPASGGTEFIVIKVKNDGTSVITIKSLLINEVDHIWDLDVDNTDLTSSSFPKAGKYSIISTSNTTPINQLSNARLEIGEEVRFVVKLSPSVVTTQSGGSTTDLSLQTPLRIKIFTGSPNPPTFVISTGDAR